MVHRFFSWSETRRFYRIGMPIFIAQMAQTGMTVVDTVMTGRYNAEAMAAVAVASSVWGPVAILGIGCLLALPSLSAQLVGGGGRTDLVTHLLRQGIWLTLMLSAAILAALYGISWWFEACGLTPELAHLAGGYLRAIMWGLPGVMFFINMRSFLEGFSNTRPAMIIAITGLGLNIPCNYMLIYGKLGLEPRGAIGCGMASAICYWFMALCMFLYLCRSPRYAALRPFFLPLFRPAVAKSAQQPWIDSALIRRILRIGFPGAMALCFESLMFACSGILLAPFGATMIAGHQVALNVASLLFVIPLAIGMTATIRVGRCLGARQVERARLAARTALGLSVGCSIIVVIGILFFRHDIVRLYTHDAAVLALAAQLLCYQAVYQIADNAQVTAVGILRGHNDTRIISVVCFIAYCILGLPLGFLLARTDFFVPHMGAAGFWIAYIIAVGLGAFCYLARIAYLHAESWEAALQRIRR